MSTTPTPALPAPLTPEQRRTLYNNAIFNLDRICDGLSDSTYQCPTCQFERHHDTIAFRELRSIRAICTKLAALREGTYHG